MLGAMTSSTVDIQTPDGVADAYLTRPEGDGRYPGVLFMIDAIGLRARIEEMADRIAARGYVVLAPNVFYRAGRAPVAPLPDFSDPASRDGFMKKIGPLMQELTPERVDSDGKAYLDYLAERATEPVAVTGYCMGVRLALRLATTYPDRVAAVGGFHGGGLVTDDPNSPHRWVGRLQAEVFLGHADQDQHMTPEHIAQLEQALDDAGVTYTSELFEGAMHGYTMSDTAAYNEAGAERHFAELFALLDRTFAAAPAG